MQIPKKIGKYEIVEQIGRGGMGYVYRAVDPILKRDVALKCMLKDIADDQDLRTRFLREAQSAGGLRHPNIVTIYDLGEDESRCPYIAMEFLTGTDLEQIIKSKTPISLSKKLDIILQTCRGLGYAHSKGIVHRDIKPANIRLLDNGEIKIMDFGIAKIAASHFTRTGMVMGTPHYMCPEQIRGEKVDGKADIFSLGVVLYELLVYRKPFPGENPTSVLFKIIHSDPDPLADSTFLPPEGLDQIVLLALAKNPQDRYQTCENFYADLLNVYYSVEPSAEPTLPQFIPTTGPVTPTPGFRKRPFTPIPGTSRNSFAQTPTPSEPATSTKPLSSRASTPTQPIARSTPASGITAEAAFGISMRQWIVFGFIAVAAIVFIALTSIYLFRKLDLQSRFASVAQQTQPSERIPQPIAPAAHGWLSLNVQPWAEIKEIRDGEGNSITPPLTLTPCKFQLKKGTYQITLVNSKFTSLKLQVDVRENETTVVHKMLDGFDHAEAIRSLGL